MKQEMAQMHRELQQMKAERPPVAATTRAAGVNAEPVAATGRNFSPLAALNQKVDELASAVELTRPGTNTMLLSGEANATWTNTSAFHQDAFFASFSPVFLWHLNDGILFEGKATIANFGTELDYAQLDWTLDDHFTLVLGKFYNPLNAYAERFEPGYIHPLPDDPLGVTTVLPVNVTGLQLRGAYSLWEGGPKVLASAFAGNAPYFDRFGPFSDIFFENDRFAKHNIAVGGRLGVQFCPNFEIGYGLEYARVQPQEDPTGTLPLLVQSVDLQAHLDALKGRWTLLGEYGWSRLRDTFSSVAAGPFATNEFEIAGRRDGGYLQLSYRATGWASPFLNRLELVARADHDAQSNSRSTFQYDDGFFRFKDTFIDPGFARDRGTLGLDYWITPTTVLKLAYEHIGITGNARDDDMLKVGFSTGL